MGYKIDPNYKNYKLFRLKVSSQDRYGDITPTSTYFQLAAEQVKSARILPSSFLNLLAPDPGLTQERPDPHVYRCRKCRRVVASKSNLITHKSMDQENSFESPLPRRRENSQSAFKFLQAESADVEDIDNLTEKVATTGINDKSITEPQICTKTFFVEPLTWMKDAVANNAEGKLYCPSCKAKIGSFNWLMASRCPCGVQVSPSFYLVPSKIEYSNVVQNILQATV